MLIRHHRFMMNFTKAFLQALARPVVGYLVTLSASAQLGFATLFYVVEVGRNPHVDSYFDALYFSVTVMTGVGLGDVVPATMLGRTVAMLMMLAGTAIFVCFTAVLSASILEAELEHEQEWLRQQKRDDNNTNDERNTG